MYQLLYNLDGCNTALIDSTTKFPQKVLKRIKKIHDLFYNLIRVYKTCAL